MKAKPIRATAPRLAGPGFGSEREDDVDDPRGRQASLNTQTRALREAFAGHRRNITDLLTAEAGGAGRGRLCVLGAGNANDLDLPALLEAYGEVHLVDLDAEALSRGIEAQGVAGHPGLVRHGGIDLTGMIDVVAGWSPRRPVHPGAVAALAEEPDRRLRATLPGPFDVTASTCLLTQIVGGAYHAVGQDHPQFSDMVRATRAGHLRLMTGLTRPGGTALLITDVTSSDVLPTLPALADAALPGVLAGLDRGGHFFHGVNPAELPGVFRRDPVLRARVSHVEPVAPWRWDLRVRVYLVWTLRLTLGTDP
jgi:hypothetical protein